MSICNISKVSNANEFYLSANAGPVIFVQFRGIRKQLRVIPHNGISLGKPSSMVPRKSNYSEEHPIKGQLINRGLASEGARDTHFLALTGHPTKHDIW